MQKLQPALSLKVVDALTAIPNTTNLCVAIYCKKQITIAHANTPFYQQMKSLESPPLQYINKCKNTDYTMSMIW